MAKYVKCPRCDLNYILEGEDYCDVCKAELKIGPSLFYDDEDAVKYIRKNFKYPKTM